MCLASLKGRPSAGTEKRGSKKTKKKKSEKPDSNRRPVGKQCSITAECATNCAILGGVIGNLILVSYMKIVCTEVDTVSHERQDLCAQTSDNTPPKVRLQRLTSNVLKAKIHAL